MLIKVYVLNIHFSTLTIIFDINIHFEHIDYNI